MVAEELDERCETCGAVYQFISIEGRRSYMRCSHYWHCDERKPRWGTPAHLHR
jgi:hypothetical protein